MSLKKYIRARFLITLRKLGLLCKKTYIKPKKLRLYKTTLVDGTTKYYNEPITPRELPKNEQSLESSVHNWVEARKLYNKGCLFDSKTQSCPCGKTVEQFAATQSCKQFISGSNQNTNI